MRQKLVEDNMGLVYHIVNRYYPTFINNEDVIQSGMLGLCQAADTFDESKGVAFSSYACKCISTEIIKEFERMRKHNGVMSLDAGRFSSDDEDAKTVADFVIGEDDVDYFDCTEFYNQLTDADKEIVDLRRFGLSGVEIAKIRGCSQQAVSKHLTRLRHKWRELYGD